MAMGVKLCYLILNKIYLLGSLVSQFVASNFVNLLTHMKSYKQKKYEQALIETYLKFDELLRMEKVNQLLIKQYSNIHSQNNNNNYYEINFQFQIDNENEIENERLSAYSTIKNNSSDKNYLRRCFLMENPIEENIYDNYNVSTQKDLNLNLNLIHSENVSPINNYLKDNERNHNYNYNNVNKNKKEKDKEISLHSIDSQKVEISLNKQSADTVKAENFSKLVAKDMGTTANILLIKNNMLYLANVGDSMAVLFKNGQAIRLNQEHKTTLQSEFTRVTKSGARIMNNRIEGRLNLTRAIGIKII